MSCEAEAQALAEMRRRLRDATYHVQEETANAELELLRWNERIYDWGVIRVAEALKRCWDTRCMQAEDALERCKKKARNKEAVARFN